MKFNLKIVILVFISCSAKAQTCNLSFRGCIADADNGEHLSFAIVKLVELDKTLQTNTEGEFEFQKVCAGNYKLLVKHFGCRDTVYNVTIKNSKRITFKLPHAAHNLNEIDIMDKRVEMKSTQTESKLSAEELEKLKGQTLGDVLKNVSGVTTLNTGGTISKPMLHGMQGYRLLLLNNGIRQEGQQWGNEHAPEIDPFIAKRVSVIKGANAIRYGSDAIAGVVLIQPNELPDTAGINGEINLVGLSNGRTGAANAMLEGSFSKIKGFAWRVQGSVKQGGNIKTPNYYITNTGIKEFNYSYALGYHRKKWGVEMYYSQFNTSIGIFRGSHIGNLTDLQNALTRGKPFDSAAVFSYTIGRPNQEATHELIKGLAHYHFASKWRLKLQYAWQYNARKEFDLRRLTNEEKITGIINPDLDLYITSQTVQSILEHDNINNFRGEFGTSYMYQENVYQGRFFIPNYIANSYGIYATERYVKSHFEAELGVRYDVKDLQSYFYNSDKIWTNEKRIFNNLSYNLGLIFKPTQKLNLFVNGGSAWRAPAPNELYSNGVHQGLASIERGDNLLKTEICYNITTSLIYQTTKLKLEATAYHNQFQNFIYLNPTNTLELTIRGAFPVFNYEQANVRISGIDLKGDYQINKHLSMQSKVMFVRGFNKRINDYLIYMPSDRADLGITYSLKETTTIKKTKLQLTTQYVNKQWRIPQNTDFAPPPSSYYLVNAELSTQVNLKKQPVCFHFSVVNLLNTVYREYLDRFRYFTDAMGVSYNLRITLPLNLYHPKNKIKDTTS